MASKISIKSEDPWLFVGEDRSAHEEGQLSLLVFLQEMQQYEDLGIGQILNLHAHWFGLHLNGIPGNKVRLFRVITFNSLWLNFLGQQR